MGRSVIVPRIARVRSKKVGFFASSRFDPNFSHSTTSHAVASPPDRKFETVMVIPIVFVQVPVPYASITRTRSSYRRKIAHLRSSRSHRNESMRRHATLKTRRLDAILQLILSVRGSVGGRRRLTYEFLKTNEVIPSQRPRLVQHRAFGTSTRCTSPRSTPQRVKT